MAMRLPINRNWLMLGAALLLGGAAVYLSHRLIQDRIRTVEAEVLAGKQLVKVVVAKRDLERGALLTAENFAIRELPADYVHRSAIRPEEFEQVEGQRLATPLRRGEPLLEAMTEGRVMAFSSTLTPGSRALTFEVDEVNSISGMLRPGDRIDLILTARPPTGNGTETTLTLLSNVEVLATGQVIRKRSEQEGERSFSTVTLSLAPEDAQRVIVAKSSGKLTAVLRHPDDAAPNHLTGMTIHELMAPRTANGGGTRRAVQYIVGNGGGAGGAL
ncbi:MAG: Flp pilus assembly protein CpaB [Burkholderiaceae bacterium]|nr:Flp pilus assembly protein CpaB [Burkholderiaceae bacterium]